MFASLRENGFRPRFALRLLLLVAAVFLFCYSALVEGLVITASLAFVLILACSFSLFRLVDATERDFARFLEDIRHGDFSAAVPGGEARGAYLPARGRDLLQRAQGAILGRLRQLNRERDTDHRYLAAVVEHVKVALVCFDQSGAVCLLNEAARELLRVRGLIHLSKLEQIDAGLAAALGELRPGEQRIVRCVLGNELHQLMLHLSEFATPHEHYRLVSLQDLKRALDENEIQSWQKLMRVLNHEIMNSMTPIVSLSRYLEGFVSKPEMLARAVDPDSEERRDLLRSVAAIHSRSKGLVDFIGGYRGLHAPAKDFIGREQVEALLARIHTLFAEQLSARGIDYETPRALPPLRLYADIHALEQILINLVANALDAVADTDNGRIALVLEVSAPRRMQLQVRDNGRGIPPALIEDIFTPFFTTKEKGSGIGLSLSRQLAQLSDGGLTVQSREGLGSVFTLSLPLV